jgi:hypothetical protein
MGIVFHSLTGAFSLPRETIRWNNHRQREISHHQ